MDAVQRLRSKAYDNKKLVTTKQQKVSVQTQENKQAIVIEQAEPGEPGNHDRSAARIVMGDPQHAAGRFDPTKWTDMASGVPGRKRRCYADSHETERGNLQDAH